MNKSDIRLAFKEKRKALSSKEQLKLNDLLLIQFQRIDFSTVQNCMTYWPLEQMNEPNTHLFTRFLQHMIPNLNIYYPKINSNNLLDAVEVNDDTVFNTNEWGITEPNEGAVIKPSKLQLILVPLLIFDQKGYRVGYGKGYYDRFLANCSNNAILLGISFFEPIQIIEDTHEFDIPLTMGITPEQIYEF
jgi:5-formyltetrahydrofolate cyclo-ligase